MSGVIEIFLTAFDVQALWAGGVGVRNHQRIACWVGRVAEKNEVEGSMKNSTQNTTM